MLYLLDKLVVPCSAEFANERFFEVPIKRHALTIALLNSTMADVPPMIVDSLEGTVVFDAQRIQVAGDRLAKRRLAIKKGTFYGAVGATIVAPAYESTLATIHKGCAQIAFGIDNRNSHGINGSASRLGHVGTHDRQGLAQDGDLIGFKRCTAIALYTASPFTPL